MVHGLAMRPYSADTSQAVPVRVRQLEIQQDGQHTRGVTAGTAKAAHTLLGYCRQHTGHDEGVQRRRQGQYTG